VGIGEGTARGQADAHLRGGGMETPGSPLEALPDLILIASGHSLAVVVDLDDQRPFVTDEDPEQDLATAVLLGVGDHVYQGLLDAVGVDPDDAVMRELNGDLRTGQRSEEHTSELQSRENLVCRLLLEKKKQEE